MKTLNSDTEEFLGTAQEAPGGFQEKRGTVLKPNRMELRLRKMTSTVRGPLAKKKSNFGLTWVWSMLKHYGK